jgi:hypothetical protein
MGRICIDGFPRSGNIFTQEVLRNVFPQAFVTHFTHSVTVLTEEHFVLIRDPNVSISSFMSVFQESDKDASERWWLRFHKTVLEKTNAERWIYFEDLTQDTKKTMEHIGNIVGLKPSETDYSKLHKNAASKPYEVHSFPAAKKFYEELKGIRSE